VSALHLFSGTVLRFVDSLLPHFYAFLFFFVVFCFCLFLFCFVLFFVLGVFCFVACSINLEILTPPSRAMLFSVFPPFFLKVALPLSLASFGASALFSVKMVSNSHPEICYNYRPPSQFVCL